MSADHLHFHWWIEGTADDQRVYVAHDCVNGEPDEWQLPPPWRVTAEGGIEPSFQCDRCGRHVILGPADRRDPPPAA